MIKKGRNIESLNLHTWICTVCGKVYISKKDALTCLNLHITMQKLITNKDKIKNGKKIVMELLKLKRKLDREHEKTKNLLQNK